jgi:AraC-like DNA-binding protein
MNCSPFLTHSWQVRFEPEDADGEKIVQNIRNHSLNNTCLVPATQTQLEAEMMLWKLSGEKVPPDMAAPIISGIARIVIGDFVLRFCPQMGNIENCGNGLTQSIKQKLAIRIRQFLEDNIEHGIRLSDMESHFHYSGRHLNRIFHDAYNCSIRDYLGERRLELTKRWLESSERTIKDIALSLGYRDSSQLCNYFMRRMSITPTDYRKEIRERKAEFQQRSVKNL